MIIRKIYDIVKNIDKKYAIFSVGVLLRQTGTSDATLKWGVGGEVRADTRVCPYNHVPLAVGANPCVRPYLYPKTKKGSIFEPFSVSVI